MSTLNKRFADFGIAVATRNFKTRAASVFGSVASASDGGYAVPQDLASEIFLRTPGALAAYCSVIPASSGSVLVPTDDAVPWATDGVVAAWEHEGNATTPDKPIFQQAEHKLRKLKVLVAASSELVADAPALAAWLPDRIGGATTWKINDQIINGLGAGRPLGVLNANATKTIAKTGGQTAGTLTSNNIGDLLDNVLDPDMSMFVIHPTCYGSVTAMAAFDSASRTLAGLPVVVSHACQPRGTRGDVVLGNFKNYRLVVKDQGMAESMHLWFDQDLVAFRNVLRLDGQPVSAGLKAPAYGAGTFGDFAVIETRA